MTATLQELKAAASDLPAGDRADLAHFLLRSLDDADAAADARGEWVALAGERMAEVKAGRVAGIPADEVLRTLLDPRP